MIEPTDEMRRAGAQAIADADLADNNGTPEEYAEPVIRAVLAIVERHQLAPLRAVLEKLFDPHSCHYDHHGDCQEHGTTSERPCPHARAKELLGWSAP